MSSSPKLAALIDADPIFREGLRCLLENSPVVRLVACGSELSCLDDHTLPPLDLLLLDADTSNGNLSGWLGDSERNGAATQRIVLTRKNNVGPEDISRWMAAGASGLIDKRRSAEHIVQEIERFARVRALHPAAGDGALAAGNGVDQIQSRLALLSPREKQVLVMVADGLTSREIADSLGIKARTVEVHRHHILGKLGVRGIADLVKFAIRAGVSSI